MSWLVNQQEVTVETRLMVSVAKSRIACLEKSCDNIMWKTGPYLMELYRDFLQQWLCVLKPIQKLFPSLEKRETTERGCNGFQWVNHCNSDSGVVCQIVVDAWPVKKNQVFLIRKLMCTLCEVTRTVIQGKLLSRLSNRSVKNYMLGIR